MALTTVTAGTLRTKLKDYLDRVSTSLETLIVSRGDERDAVVIMSLATYNALTETNNLLASKANREHLLASIEQLQAGNTTTVGSADIDELLAKRKATQK